MSSPDQHSQNHNSKEANQFLKNIFFILVGLLLSYLFVKNTHQAENKPSMFDELLEVIKDNYVDSIGLQSVEKNAIGHLLNTLDPHSIFISKEELQQANEPLEGNFSGIGIEFFIARDTITVVSPISGGPSEQAGIKSGDKIITINDTNVAGVNVSNPDVFKRLRGERGSKVKLRLIRNEQLLPSIIIKRDNIAVNSVEPALLIDEQIGYIKINSFGENTYYEFQTELKRLLKIPTFKSLVIDVRQNTGGYLETAVSILDELVEENKLLVYTEGLHYRKEKFYSKKAGLFEKGDLAILIDEGSASASEILAGCIQDLDRGVVIGRRSFGKGLVQNQIQLSDGSAVRLTVARYFTPSGRNIQKPYKANERYEDEILDRYKKGEFFESIDNSSDTQTYRTAGGKIVKGNGGITPDYFVGLDTNYDLQNYTILRSFVPDFVYSNYSRFAPQVSNYKNAYDFVSHYSVDKAMMVEFLAFAKGNGAIWLNNRQSSYDQRLRNSIKSFIAKQFYKSEGFYMTLNYSDNVILKAKTVLKANR